MSRKIRRQRSRNSPEALLQKAVCCINSNDMESGKKHALKALRISPGHGNALNLLGIISQRTASMDKALDYLKGAVAAAPQNPDFLFNLANAYELAFQFDEAASTLRRALAIDPFHISALVNLGNIYQKFDQPDDAIACYRKAADLSPHDYTIYINLGIVHKNRNDYCEALSCYKKALSLNPRSHSAYYNIANIYKTRLQFDEAEEKYLAALKLKPDCAEALSGLIFLFERQNRLQEARPYIDQAMKVAPESPLVILAAAKIARRQQRLDEAYGHITKILSQPGINNELKAQAQTERGILMDRLGNYDEAFQAFQHANTFYRNKYAPSPAELSFLPDKIEQYSLWASHLAPCKPSPPGQEKSSQVFLIGFPRSGTTLLEQILSSHPDIITVDEKPFITDLQLPDLSGIKADSFQQIVDTYSQELLAQKRQQYWQWVESEVGGPVADKTVIDKLPLNIVDLPLLLLLFPQAKFIVALRDPRDVCLSCFMQQFALNRAMIHFFTINDAAQLYNKIMALWTQYVEKLPLSHINVRYEDVVSDYEGEAKRLIDFLGLDWSEEIHTYRQRLNGKSISTPSYSQVAESIYNRSCGRWRNYDTFFTEALPILEPFIQLFGYESSSSAYKQEKEIFPTELALQEALAHQRGGNGEKALVCYQKILAHDPDHPTANHHLGVLLSQHGKKTEAVAFFKKATEHAPGNITFLFHYALSLQQTGKPDHAQKILEEVLLRQPDHYEALNELGIAYKEMGQHHEAIAAYVKAIGIKDDYFKAYNNLGLAYQQVKKFDEAEKAFVKAIALQPDLPEAVTGLAMLLEKMNRLPEAEKVLARAIEAFPSHPQTIYSMAKIYVRRGLHEKAVPLLNRLMNANIDPELLALAAGELGKVLDKQGNYREAFAVFLRANNAQKRTASFHQLEKNFYPQLITALRDQCPPAAVNRVIRSSPPEDGTPSPVFMVGFPRSGTTLLEQILASHSGLAPVEEIPLLSAIRRRLLKSAPVDKFPAILQTLSSEEITGLRKSYLAAMQKSLHSDWSPGKTIIDKLPLNIVDLPLIKILFPKAKIIVSLRDPRDVCLSCFMQVFKLNEAMVHFLDINTTVKLYEMVMDLWLHYRDTLELDYATIRYEDLVHDFEAEMRKVIHFLEKPWEDSMLEFHETAQKRNIATPSYTQVTNKIYTGAIGRWKRYQEQLSPILDQLQPFVGAFGYDAFTE